MNGGINQNTFVDVVKIAAIVFALLHMGIGFAMFRQVVALSNKVETRSRGCIRLFSLLHILILAGIVILVIFI